jgi:hypothetical protein
MLPQCRAQSKFQHPEGIVGDELDPWTWPGVHHNYSLSQA